MTDGHSLLLVGHGSHTSPAASEPLYAHADRLRREPAFNEVLVAVWDGEPHLRESVRRTRYDRVTIVPVMMAGGYYTDQVFPRELRLTGDSEPQTAKRIRYTDPVGTHPGLTAVIVSLAERITGDPAVGPGVGLAVVGHGTNRHESSGTSTHEHADRIRATDRFEEVVALFLDESPHANTLLERVETESIVVVPMFVSNGPHTREDVPAAIGLPSKPHSPVTIGDKRIWYSSAVGTAPAMAEIIAERARSSNGRYVRSADVPSSATEGATAAFQRWLLDGPIRDWGELRISVRSHDDQEIRFSIRHRADANRSSPSLDSITDIRELRDRVRFDDDGQYRPIAGIMTLPSGWIIDTSSIEFLARIVDTIYPASVINWYLERTDSLDVTGFDDATTRHTGRYGALTSASRTDQRAAMETVCIECSRRPAWADGAGDESPIPCSEPCSLLLSLLAEYDDRSPPPSETDPSVADGAIDEPGNRFRERYLARRSTRAVADGEGQQ